MVDVEYPAFIIDNGSRVMKCGFAGDGSPRSVFPTVIGRLTKSEVENDGKDSESYYLGKEVTENHEKLEIKYPIEHGVILNWEDMEKLWKHAYDIFGTNSESQPVLMTEIPFNPKENREKTTRIIFEEFNVPNFYIGTQPVFSLLATGRTTGLVVESGANVTHTVPIYEGFALPSSILRMNIGGNNVTDKLGKLIGEKGHENIMKSFGEKLILEEMKEKLCYVPIDYESEVPKEEDFELPDRTKITLGKERFQAPEILFKPSMIQSEVLGIDELLYNSILRVDIDLLSALYQNIVLGGGNSMIKGFAERLKKDMVGKHAPRNARVGVCAHEDRKNLAFVGASIRSSLSTFRNEWITKYEYDDAGATIVHRKCF